MGVQMALKYTIQMHTPYSALYRHTHRPKRLWKPGQEPGTSWTHFKKTWTVHSSSLQGRQSGSQSNKGKPWPFLYRCTWDVINTVNEKRVKFLFVSVKLRCNITMTAFQWVKKTHWVHSNVLDKCVNYTLFTLTVILIKCIVNDQSQPMMQRIEILETEFWRLYFEMVR